MAGTSAGGNDWRITGEERAKHDAQFFPLKPVNGFITGEQAKTFFMQSGVPTATLGQIWGLADMNNDGKMDKKEFSIAMHLIKKKLQGYELPRALPASLKADPSPVIGSFGIAPGGPPTVMGAGMSQPTMAPVGMMPGQAVPTLGGPGMGMRPPVSGPMGMPLMTNGVAPGMIPGGFMAPPMAGGYGATVLGDTKQRAGSFTGSPTMPGVGAPRPGMWTISHPNKMKYTQMFNMNDRNKHGHLTGVEARSILMQSGLPQQFLAQIWSLSDVDNDGKLVCEEFCIAMHLVDVAKMGQPLPAKLPAELIPPGMKGRSGSIGMPGGTPNMAAAAPKESFGDLLGGMGISQPPPMMAPEEPPQPAEEESPVTFEDKRKMNFDKGQAELDRRRAALQEQLRRDEDARLEKERRQQEKRDQIRQEQELKRQQELERQMEKQRQIEREKEEQRRKMMEQREAAKREQERQRQMEWERLRKEQLLAEKHREYQQLESLKSHNNTLKCELEAMDGKKVEIRQKIEQVRIGVTDFTTSIEMMRQTRDDKLTNIDQFDRQLQEFNQKFTLLQKQRDSLNLQVQTTPQAAPVSDTYRTVLHSVETKKKNIQNLKDELEKIEKQTANKLQEIDTNNIEFTEIKNRVTSQQQEMKLQEKKRHEEKQREMDRRRQQEKQETDQKHQQEQHDKENRLRQQAPSESDDDKNTRVATSNQASWFSGFSTASKPATNDMWGSNDSSSATQIDWGNAFSSQTPAASDGVKYKALYQFDAKNQDEISLQIGDIVVISKDQSGAEPGWMSGVCNDKKGWFPEQYVEIVSASGNQMKAGITLSGITEEESHTDDIPASDLFGSADDQSFPMMQPPAASPTPGQGEVAPEGMQVQACYPWKAKKENHLTFNKGDLITVKEQQDMWWSGELNGKFGWFPKSYVKPVTSDKVDQPSSESPSVNQMANVMSSSMDSEEKSEGGDNYVAMYPYTSEEMTDLTFKQGDVITVTQTDGDWWSGKFGNRTGIFPANYVKKVELQPGIKTSKKPEIATVIAPYTATGSEQLSLQPGQLLQVRKKSASGWWEGELQARGQKRKIGWFPANYVKLLGSSSARSTPVSPAQQNTSPAEATSAPVSSQPSYVDQVMALYDYAAQNDDELTFHKDSVLNVISKDEAEWWKGELNGQIGMFPSNYAGPLSSTDQSPLAPSWSSDPAVIATTSAQESKRQNAIQELITTEESYNKDMSIMLEVFCKPFADAGVLSPQEIDAVFVNWTELIVCNIKLLKSLRVRKKLCKGQPINVIGDILCENLPHMTPYIRFCSCQLNAAALIQHKTENSPEFNEVHRKCTQDPRTKGMPLSSFLLKPMQRITRYPLLINKILQYTPEEHHDHQNMTEALANAVEQCSQVNEAVHEKDNSDKLEWIQQHVQCDGLPEKITFNSVTNCLGPRKFMYSGTLYKIKSNKELVAFLFNDFLLLTQPIRALGSIVSVFSFDTKATTQYRMYKQPIVLNEIMVKKSTESESDPCQFQISHIDRVYNLKTVTPTERDSWYKNINNSQKNYLDTERQKRERAHSFQKQRNQGVGRLLVIIVEGTNLMPSGANVRRTTGMGRLVVVIVEGRELRASDANGKSDPYCEVSMGSQEHKTKVINSTLNPKWNASMQFMIKDLEQDVLCITVYDRDLFSPNDFLGRTEVRVAQIHEESKTKRGPITKSLVLHEVDCGEVTVKLDLLLFEPS